jgi:pyrimidine operon attenuation protein/uracil phosphoribosyltransferase
LAPDTGEKVVLDGGELARTITRIAHEIVERNGDRAVALVGIHNRGVPLARRLARLIGEFGGEQPPVGELDISFYRDDIGTRGGEAPVVHSTRIDFDTDSHVVVLVDDVLFTGRTVRAAIDALLHYGRPPVVQLAVLADRGHRELPIRPDFVGKNLPTSTAEHVYVRLEETDGTDEIAIGAAQEHAIAHADHHGGDGETT